MSDDLKTREVSKEWMGNRKKGIKQTYQQRAMTE